ncbi:hypothetical protein [Massilia sp. LjRoot122]|uniref:hypothetical protein n=1 Tax=Massilia sp. LjRoot122 TaxID=3342257 RepID=UPI003ECE8EBD
MNSEMQTIKLSCSGCAAPLEIGTDLDRFACGYCGTSQIVERKGGVVSLKRFESAINAVQRGTDRTAAELAVPRLTRELAQVRLDKSSALHVEHQNRSGARSGRMMLCAIVFLITSFGGLVAGSKLESPIIMLIALLASVSLPVYVFIKTKLPADRSAEIAAEFDNRIARLEASLQANRAVLDTPL